jgi:hypothetical protein
MTVRELRVDRHQAMFAWRSGGRSVFRQIAHNLLEGASMSRAALSFIGLGVAAVLTAGCDDKKSSGSVSLPTAVKSLEEKGKKEAEELMAKGKADFLKPVEAMIPKIEEKIKGLSGDAKSTATTKFDELTALIKDFKSAAPDKWEGMKEKLTEKLADIKKLVGL